MALRLPLRRLVSAARTQAAPLSLASLHPQKPRPRSLAEGGGSCGGGGAPACPPCEPAAQPLCRARPPAVRRALRVVCCAPPQGSRPPCPPREPPCALTCRDVIDQHRTVSTTTTTRAREENEECPAITQSCGVETDRVARRLALAKQSRRRDYECEVARRAADTRPTEPPAATYRLGDERECARATDGRLYTMPHAADARRARCGPDRTPPAPRCVELTPDDNCRIRDEARLDPCAHRPRVMIEIDRHEGSASAKSPSTAGARLGRDPPLPPLSPPLSTCRKQHHFGKSMSRERFASPKSPKSRCTNIRATSSEGLTSRIIKTLNFGGSENCPRGACGGKCDGGGARRAGDDSWCANLPPPIAVPPRCRKPGIADRLRTRSAPTGTESRCKRKLHTSSAAPACGAEVATGSEGLEETLRRRSLLKEAGQGRVVVNADEVRSKRVESPGGRLDIPVPAGTERVRVRVSLDGARKGPCAGARPAPCAIRFWAGRAVEACSPAHSPTPASACPNPADPCQRLAATGDRRDSWLSIKNIQKKLSGSRRSEEPGVGPSPSQRPASPPTVPQPARPPPCLAPAAPRTPKAGGAGRQKNRERGPKKCTSTGMPTPDATVAGS